MVLGLLQLFAGNIFLPQGKLASRNSSEKQTVRAVDGTLSLDVETPHMPVLLSATGGSSFKYARGEAHFLPLQEKLTVKVLNSWLQGKNNPPPV